MVFPYVVIYFGVVIGGSLRVLGALHQISVQNISPGYFYRAQKHLPHRFSWLCTEDRKLGGGLII